MDEPEEPRLETTTGAEFSDETVAIDGEAFVDCTFTRCTLTYSGGELFFLPGSRFRDCTFEFDGPALRTLEALRVLNRFGMNDFVERILGWVTRPVPDEGLSGAD